MFDEKRHRPLSDKEVRFAKLYAVSGNATRSWVEAGFPASSREIAQVSACRLAHRPRVARLVADIQGDLVREARDAVVAIAESSLGRSAPAPLARPGARRSRKFELTARDIAFAERYFQHGCAAQAYRESHPGERPAQSTRVLAFRLLRKPHMLDLLAAMRADAIESLRGIVGGIAADLAALVTAARGAGPSRRRAGYRTRPSVALAQAFLVSLIVDTVALMEATTVGREVCPAELKEVRSCQRTLAKLALALKKNDLAALPSLATEFKRLTSSPAS